MSYLNLDIITDAARIMNALDETSAPSPEQGVMWLAALNDLMAEFEATGIRLGWFPQTDLSATAPLQNADVRAVKLCLAAEIASRLGQPLSPETASDINNSYTALVKRYVRYMESDMSELPKAQGYYQGIWY